MNPDPDPSFQINAKTLEKISKVAQILTFWLVICKLMRIQVTKIMWIRIHNTVDRHSGRYYHETGKKDVSLLHAMVSCRGVKDICNIVFPFNCWRRYSTDLYNGVLNKVSSLSRFFLFASQWLFLLTNTLFTCVNWIIIISEEVLPVFRIRIF